VEDASADIILDAGDVLNQLFKQIYHSTVLRLVVLSFVVYNANLRSITSLDTLATRFVPISIIKEFNLDLDEFPVLHKRPVWLGSQSSGDKIDKNSDQHSDENGVPYYVRFTRGHYMPTFPVMGAVLSVPVYIIPVLLGLTDGPPSATGYTRTEIMATFLSKISASLAVAISVGFVYLTLLRSTSRTGALWIALVYAFATGSWSISSQGLWQSAMGQPALALAFYFFVKARENARHVIYAGIPLAISVACRPSNIIFAVVFFIYVIHRYRSEVFRFMVSPTILGMFLAAYNLYYFGMLGGGYSNSGTLDTVTSFRWDAFLGLLFSPSRGLLIYSPVFIFAFFGIRKTWNRTKDPLFIYTAVATILLILFYSFFPGWHGAFGYGYRVLVELVPGLCLLLGTVYDRIFANRWTRTVFAMLFLYSVSIQMIGAFDYPCGWYDSPANALENPKRFWDWHDPEFARCLRAGPVDPDGLRLIRQIVGKH